MTCGAILTRTRPARLHLATSAPCPVAGLPLRQAPSARHPIADPTLPPGGVARDDLAWPRHGRGNQRPVHPAGPRIAGPSTKGLTL